MARQNTAKTRPNRGKATPKGRKATATPSARKTATKPAKPQAKNGRATRRPRQEKSYVSYEVGSSPIYVSLRYDNEEWHIFCALRGLKTLEPQQLIGLLEIFSPYHVIRTGNGKVRSKAFVKEGVTGRYADYWGVGVVFHKSAKLIAARLAERVARQVEERFGDL